MKKILITGSNGLLGQKLLDLYTQNPDIQIIATSKGEDRYLQSGYIYESLDITNNDEVRNCILKHKPEAVINTAAMTNVDGCESQKELCYKLNVQSVSFLAQACKEIDAHLVHISTDFIFDGENGPYKEDDKPNPLSYYGESKLLSEKTLIDSGAKYSILRTMIVFGVIKDMSRSNIVLWAKAALEKGQELTIVDDQIRTPTLAEDLALGCALVIEKKAFGIFNISGKDLMSMFDLVVNVANFWNLDKNLVKPIKSTSLNMAARRPTKTGFILDKAIKELGYTPHSFKESLEIVNKSLK